MLQPDPKDILTSIYQELRNPGVTTSLDEPFVVPPYAVRVNCFLFAGLFASMLVALLGILVKQWTRSYQRELAGVSSPHLRARIRHFRYNGAKRWHLASIVGLLSIFMHLALFISAIGIIDLLLSTASTVGYVALSVFLVGVTFFFVTTVLPLFVLDAPFRSPLSKLLSGIKRRAKRIRIPTHLYHMRIKKQSDDKETAKEEGLEDHIEQSQGKESDENSIVRTQIHLDLDIICHILSTADKSTERWLLDLCFEKLPNLTLLEQHDPSVFHSRGIIIEVYNFLAEGCIMTNKKGEREVNSDRLPRARQLCKFIAWYLSLPKTTKEREDLQKTLDRNSSATTLATLLADDEHIPSVVVATTALGHLHHFRDPRSSDACTTCQQGTSDVNSWAADEDPLDGRDEEKVKQVTSLLVKVTDCLLLWDKNKTEPPEKMASEYQESLETLQKAIRKCNPTEKDKKLWVQALLEKEKGASTPLKDIWFTPLRTTLDGLSIRRGVSPFRPGDASTSGASVTIQAPRSSYGSQQSRSSLLFSQPSSSSGQGQSGSPIDSPTSSFLRPPPFISPSPSSRNST
jgi:Family of unknown function (DUF6535)